MGPLGASEIPIASVDVVDGKVTERATFLAATAQLEDESFIRPTCPDALALCHSEQMPARYSGMVSGGGCAFEE